MIDEKRKWIIDKINAQKIFGRTISKFKPKRYLKRVQKFNIVSVQIEGEGLLIDKKSVCFEWFKIIKGQGFLNEQK